MSASRVVVDLRNVSRVHDGPPPVTALAGVDLTVLQQEYVAVVGPSGAGKSTLMHLLGLLDKPSSGTYLLGDVDTGGLGEGERTALRAERIGFVFQDFHLLPYRTVLDNVAAGLLYGHRKLDRGARRTRSLAVLGQVGLADRGDSAAGVLSGGERQRVAIARALVSEPSLLLCDEPTGNLDSATSGRILALLDEVHRAGQTVVVVTHDPQVAARATRRITVADGAIVDDSRSTR